MRYIYCIAHMISLTLRFIQKKVRQRFITDILQSIKQYTQNPLLTYFLLIIFLQNCYRYISSLASITLKLVSVDRAHSSHIRDIYL